MAKSKKMNYEKLENSVFDQFNDNNINIVKQHIKEKIQ